jgi:hypothetical protein
MGLLVVVYNLTIVINHFLMTLMIIRLLYSKSKLLYIIFKGRSYNIDNLITNLVFLKGLGSART